MNNIRNFSIIAHIDHGKSTLADRLLELTGTVEKRKMREQVLDQMDIERERGITIQMQPVCMAHNLEHATYKLNLIDTPGHIDFAYEVSRSLKAVEGVLLLVDAVRGVQAQTMSVFEMARSEGLAVIPVVNKIDLPNARINEAALELERLTGVPQSEILRISAKEGIGVQDVLDAIITRIPPPEVAYEKSLQALVFDFEYSDHQGVVVYTRVYDGVLAPGQTIRFLAAGRECKVHEVGVFVPNKQRRDKLSSGEIGYVVTGVKEPGLARVGDTITSPAAPARAVPGFRAPRPVVWASLYPESQDDFPALRRALERLTLEDASLTFEEEASGVLGRGFRVGFLGLLHLEIITERLRREFSLECIVSNPTINYQVTVKSGETLSLYSPAQFPASYEITIIEEPWVAVSIVTPSEHVGKVMQLASAHEATVTDTKLLGETRLELKAAMPLRELMRNFFDELKSATQGFASLSYEWLDRRKADVVRLEVLVAEEEMPALSRIVSRARAEYEARELVTRLHDILPKQQFVVKIQARVRGRIVASRTLSALRKDVTGYLYGGDVTRKKKLLEKQKKGKKALRERGRVHIPQEVFIKLMRGNR